MKWFLSLAILVACVATADAGEVRLFGRWFRPRLRYVAPPPIRYEVPRAVQKDAVQKEAPVQKDDAAQKPVAATINPRYAICLRKARIQAARGRVCHPGGSLGGCHYEGCGSGATAAQALAACCYSGRRVVAAQAVVRGANGRWYATRLFW